MNGNTTTIEGNLTKDFVVRELDSGRVVATSAIARSGKTRDGREWGPEFYDVDIWGPVAHNVAASLGKGDRVVVHGALKFGEWMSNGERRTKVSINADSVSPSLRWATAVVSKVAPAPAVHLLPGFAEEPI